MKKKTIIIIIAIILGITGIFIYMNKTKESDDINITNKLGDYENVNSEVEKNKESKIKQIKEEKYAMITGENKLGICVPQTYISNNIISVNKNKNENIIVLNATNFIEYGIGSSPKFIYIEDENKEIEVTTEFNTPESLVIQERVDNTDIYVVKSDDPEYTAQLDRKRYIRLEGVPFKEHIGKKMECYIVLEPTYEIENKKVLEIAQNIEVLSDRGEFAKSGEKNAKLIINEEELVKKVGKVTFDFRNVDIYEWSIGTSTGVGNNQITYFVTPGDKESKVKIELPIGKNGKTTSLSDLKNTVEESKNRGIYPQELIEMNIDGNTFYAVRQETGGISTIQFVYMELEGDMLVSFYPFMITNDMVQIETFIRERVLNKVVFIDA